MSPDSITPNLARQAEIQPQADAISKFLDWLRGDKGFILTKPHYHDETECFDGSHRMPICGFGDEQLLAADVPMETLLAEFFGINLEALARERALYLREAIDQIKTTRSA